MYQPINRANPTNPSKIVTTSGIFSIYLLLKTIAFLSICSIFSTGFRCAQYVGITGAIPTIPTSQFVVRLNRNRTPRVACAVLRPACRYNPGSSCGRCGRGSAGSAQCPPRLHTTGGHRCDADSENSLHKSQENTAYEKPYLCLMLEGRHRGNSFKMLRQVARFGV